MGTDLRNSDDRAYDPIRDMKKQFDILSGAIGGMRSDLSEIRTALTGNEMGTEGLVARVENMEGRQMGFELDVKKIFSKLEEYEKSAKVNRRYVLAFIGVLGTVAGTIIKIVIDHLMPVKK